MSNIIEVNVVTKSVRFAISRKDGKIKIHLKNAPEKNKANLELISELSSAFNCAVRLIAGATSRRKKLELSISKEEFEEKLSRLSDPFQSQLKA